MGQDQEEVPSPRPGKPFQSRGLGPVAEEQAHQQDQELRGRSSPAEEGGEAQGEEGGRGGGGGDWDSVGVSAELKE